MDFIKKKVRQFQEKKLDEILDKIQFHEHVKNQLERKITGTMNPEAGEIKKEISSNKKNEQNMEKK